MGYADAEKAGLSENCSSMCGAVVLGCHKSTRNQPGCMRNRAQEESYPRTCSANAAKEDKWGQQIMLRLPPAAAGLGCSIAICPLQSLVHPFSLCSVIVSQEEAAQQVPLQAFNPLLPFLLLSAPVCFSCEGSTTGVGEWLGTGSFL